MKKILLLVFLIGVFHQIRAQSLSPFVIAPAGSLYSNSTGQLSFTTGELSLVQTYSAGSSILTQGFQQAWDFGVGITNVTSLNDAIRIYPNPTTGLFQLSLESSSTSNATLIVYDATGRKLHSEELSITNGPQVFNLDLSSFSRGIYLIEFIETTNDNSILKSTQKIQLIN